MLKKYWDYLRDNPQDYWFKRKIYGWGWIPVKWQGWLVVLLSIGLIVGGAYIGETDDTPGAAALGVLLGVLLIFGFGFWKGEKPKWQWGLKK